jgi:hypothetical protein
MVEAILALALLFVIIRLIRLEGRVPKRPWRP